MGIKTGNHINVGTLRIYQGCLNVCIDETWNHHIIELCGYGRSHQSDNLHGSQRHF